MDQSISILSSEERRRTVKHKHPHWLFPNDLMNSKADPENNLYLSRKYMVAEKQLRPTEYPVSMSDAKKTLKLTSLNGKRTHRRTSVSGQLDRKIQWKN